MKLSREQINDKLKDFSGWKIEEDEIEKTFEFENFDQAMVFVNQVADLARKADHHPEIEINYNKVKLELSTHAEGGVTEKDITLAVEIAGLK